MRMDEVVDVCDRDWWLAEWFNWFILLLIRPMLKQWEVTIAWVALKHVGSVYVLSNSIEHIATGSVRCSYMDNGTSLHKFDSTSDVLRLIVYVYCYLIDFERDVMIAVC